MKDKIVLLDQDGVLAGFDEHFLEIWKSKYPYKRYVPLEERRTFNIEDNYYPEDEKLIRAIIAAPGFFRDLPPLEGAIEAVKELSNLCELFICTSPLRDYGNSFEKYEWVDKNLGKPFVKRVIQAKDKTLVRGDFLVDDRPDVAERGIIKPTWEHILYSRPYNREVTGKRRMTWENWREVLNL